MRQEYFKIALPDAEEATELEKFQSQSGKSYRKEAQERRLLHQARVLGWGKEKSYYFAHKSD